MTDSWCRKCVWVLAILILSITFAMAQDAGAQDTDAPVLQSLDISNASVNTSSGAQTITLNLTFTDENAVSLNAFSLENITNNSEVAFTQQGDWITIDEAHSATFTAELSGTNQQGIWFVSGMLASDALGNSNTLYDTSEELIFARFNPFVSLAKQLSDTVFDANIEASATFSQTSTAQTSLLNVTLQDAQEYEIWFIPNDNTVFTAVTFSDAISVSQACSIFNDFAKCVVTSSNNNQPILATIETTADDINAFGYSALVQPNANNFEADWVDNYVEFPPEDFDGDGTPNEQDLDDDNDGVPDTEDLFPLDATESEDFDNDGVGNNSDDDDDNDGVPDDQDDFPFDDTEFGDNDGDGQGDIADTDDDNDGVVDSADAFPFDSTESVDTDADGVGNNADDDDDNDGGTDDNDAFPLDPNETIDSDGDGVGNNEDTDDDNDGTLDVNDAFPRDPTEDTDTDEDGTGNNTDDDDDNDGILDELDTFPLDPGEFRDNDLDGVGDNTDNDDDNDGVLDFEDEFPFNANESIDTDNDGIGNNADFDDDNDGLDDTFDAFPLDASEVADFDGDLIGNNADDDDDNDGVLDNVDAFPFAVTEWFDTDGDGIGNNADLDNDNDGVDDEFDAFDNDPTEIADFDGDGVGNNADPDDDNDGVNDTADAFPFDPSEDLDTDLDGVGNNTDDDDDGDNVLDEDDLFPLDRNESVDNDLDGIGNNADNDDDNDGVTDTLDAFPFDATETLDFDNDGTGDNADLDDDNDNFPDTEDLFPFDPTEWVDNDLDGVGDNRDTDDDNDGVVDTADAFPFDANETLDNDNDGVGNNEDTDDDNDGVLDEVDAFPFSDAESVDTDGDGIGNNADTDDDNDGIVDEDDSQPFNATIGDNTPPVLDNLDDLTIEATGVLTPVVLDEPRVSDDNLNAATLSNDYTGPLPLGENFITWTAVDFAGNETDLVQTVTIVDTIAPEFASIATIEIPARGFLTDVSQDISLFASDIVDGEVSANIITESKLSAGQQSIVVSATDESGNTSMLEVFVDIQPIIIVKPNGVGAPGNQVVIPVNLSGQAARYPVTLEYAITGPVTSNTSGVLEISEGQNAYINLDIAQTALLGEQVFVALASPVNASIGETSQVTIDIDTTNLAPIATIVAKQNDLTTGIIFQDQGEASLLAIINDINLDDRHTVQWSILGTSVTDTNTDTNAASFQFDPTSLDEGAYIAQAIITESNTIDAFSITVEFPVLIQAIQSSLSEEIDSDFDGFSDLSEGRSDTDEDGIANYLDSNSYAGILPTGVSEQPLTTLPGYELTIGDIARLANGETASSSVISLADLATYGSATGAETSLSTDIHYEAVQNINNFNIENLDFAGQSIPVVVPLSTGTSIPADATYRKFNSRDGWFSFVENTNNAIYSAPFDSDGNCPETSSSLYLSGLNEGDTCIQLVIQDGGPNDADLNANGVIKDPGVLALELPNTSPLISVAQQTTVFEGDTVRVDASLTSDAQNDELTFNWTQIGGTLIGLSESTTPLLSFVAPNVDGNQNFRFRLEVFDGRDISSTIVNVSVRDTNSAPTGSIDAHSTNVDEGTSVNLSLSANDADSDSLQINWIQVSGPSIVINGASTEEVSFTAPQVSGNANIVLQVTISDGVKEIALSTTITIVDTTDQDANNAPSTDSGESGGGSLTHFTVLFLLLIAFARRIQRPYVVHRNHSRHS